MKPEVLQYGNILLFINCNNELIDYSGSRPSMYPNYDLHNGELVMKTNTYSMVNASMNC